MIVTAGFISGFNIGIEYAEDDTAHYVMINLGIVCVLLEKYKETS
jgi:hypothetical protein